MKSTALAWKTLPSGFAQLPILRRIAYWIATGLGTGHLPAAGTWGTLLAWGIHALLYPRLFTPEQAVYGASVLAFVILLGTLCAEITERITGEKDDSRINVDEIAGYCTAVFLLPAGWFYSVTAFFLFRLFDVIKPPPARGLQNLHGGIGIMLDDLIAGLYAGLILQGAHRIFG